MPEMILPGVYIQERAEALIVGGAITVGNIGIVGTASQGAMSTATLLGSAADARAAFGNYDPWVDGLQNELTLVRALELAYANGASTVWAVRVQDALHPAVNATFKLAGDTNTGPCALLTAASPGTWANDMAVNVWDADQESLIQNELHSPPLPAALKLERKPVAQDPRNRVQVRLAATGQTRVFKVVYAAPQAGEVQIDPASGNLTFHAGEAPVPNDTLTATYVVPKANSRRVTISFGSAAEIYTVADGAHLVAQVNDPDAPSQLITAAAGTKPAELPKKFTAQDELRQFGKGSDTPGSNGETATRADYKAGLDLLLNLDAHIILSAGRDDTTGATGIGSDLTTHVESASTDRMKHERIGVLGSRPKGTLAQILGHPLASARIVFVAPGIQVTDGASGKEVTLPGSYAAAAVAGMLSGLDPHISLTNKTIGVDGVEAPAYTPDKLEQLVQARVLALEDHQGIRVVKGITTDAGAFRQITTRRIVDYARYGVRAAAEPFIGLLNNDRVRKALKGSINGFLAGMVDDEMLISYDLDVTATRDEELRGIAVVTMTLQPTFSIDFIKVVMYLG